MLHATTGTLTCDEPPIRLTADLTRSEMLAAPWAQLAVDWVVNEPWHSWKVAPFASSGESYFIVIAYFEGQRLARADLCETDPSSAPKNWADWSLDEEMARKGQHDRWLETSIGPQRSFSWGSVWSGYDERSGCSSIVIRYESRSPGAG